MGQKSSGVNRETVAKAAGVSPGAVSLALRGQVGVSEKTRARVVAVAAKLGYRINPVASLLAAGQRKSGKTGQLVVAYLSQVERVAKSWLAACQGAGVDGQWMSPSQFPSPEAAARILWARGVHGIVLGDVRTVWSAAERARFEWARFSVVTESRVMPDVRVHLVRHSAFDYMTLALNKVVEGGYRRVAVVLMRTLAVEDDQARLGALLAFRERMLPAGVRFEWREMPADRSRKLDAGTLAWLRKEKPDVILLYHWTLVYPLMEAGYVFPGDVALAAVLAADDIVPRTPNISGCRVQAYEHHRRTLRLLMELIARGEQGFAEHPLQHVIEPEWAVGETLEKTGR